MSVRTAVCISGVARTRSEFWFAFGTTRLLPITALTSVASAPFAPPRAFCHGNSIVVPAAVPPDPAPVPVVFDESVAPPASKAELGSVTPCSGAVIPAPDPLSASNALIISASETALAYFS